MDSGVRTHAAHSDVKRGRAIEARRIERKGQNDENKCMEQSSVLWLGVRLRAFGNACGDSYPLANGPK